MIRVDLRRVPEGGRDYETVAQLSVADDGTYDIDDPQGQFPLGLHVLDFGDDEHAGPPRQVHFEEDPAAWARNLDTLLRGGYLVPVIVHDDALDAGAEKGS
jgi:hypothetical protein